MPFEGRTKGFGTHCMCARKQIAENFLVAMTRYHVVRQERKTFTKHWNSVFYVNGLVKLEGLVFLTLLYDRLYSLSKSFVAVR